MHRIRLPAIARMGCVVSVSLFVAGARAQSQEEALNAVRGAVHAEMTAAQDDHSAWDYRDHDVQPDADKVSQVIETPNGNLSRVLELNGRALSGPAQRNELDRLGNYVNSSTEQAKARKDGAHDDAQATELLKMLPTAFVWTIGSQDAEGITLRFHPNPDFRSPDMQSRVLGAMAGEMVIAHDGDRIQTLRGTLTDDVKFGFGVLGRMDKGGTFDVERRQVAPKHWAITETHVHIGGKALLFKSIGEQEDETKTDWRPSTAPNLQAALEQISR